MMMHLLIRDQKDGILCPVPSHSLYTSAMLLQGATLVCTVAVTRKKERERERKSTSVTNYYAIPFFFGEQNMSTFSGAIFPWRVKRLGSEHVRPEEAAG
jgi:hypothetical protein